MEARDAVRALSTVGKGAVKIKAMAVGAVVFVLFLCLVGFMAGAGGGQAFANSCGDRGEPSVDYGDDGGDNAQNNTTGNVRKNQIANAKTIDTVAADGGLPGRATLVALMTALQESSLLNLDHGDLDSVGLFQQRPSQGWGTRTQLMNPEYSTRMFLFGADSKSTVGIHGLTDIKGWETMPLWKAAASVQHPAKEYEQLYAGQESAARDIAKDAGIDLERAGTGGSSTGDQADDTTADQSDNGDCYPEDGAGGGIGKPGAPFHDGAADWPAVVKNPRSTADAIAWAKNEADSGGGDWYRACLAFVARAYGWNFSGVNYAVDHYKEMPASMKHDGDRMPPPGALMYWDTGKRAGHVAIYIGDGKIASSDVLRPGYIDVVPATYIEKHWQATYLGWAPPYFPKGG